jgi:CDP-glucose 4,6-dehydratase
MATARAGNVIGGGDVAPDRLLPDARRAMHSGAPLRLRYPKAVRPWQFVLEPLHGYLLLAQRLVEAPSAAPPALNFGPPDVACVPVVDLVERVFDAAGKGSWELEERVQPHESPVLRLDAGLAARALGWRPRLDLDQAVAWTLEWWRAEEEAADLAALAHAQIDRYEALLRP